MRYNNSNEFLQFLKNSLRKPFPPGKRNGEFDEQTRRSLESLGRNFELGAASVEALDAVISGMAEDIINSQPEHVRSILSGKLAFGVLETGIANAFIMRGKGNCHAILVHLGLMILLNKAIKLWIGGSVPNGIAWCDVKDASTLTDEDVHRLLEILFENYKMTGVPRGPLVKLNPQLKSKYAISLHISESFILCHEMGHYLNGDLNSRANVHAAPGLQDVEYYAGDSSIEKEHDADVAGFGLLHNYCRDRFPKLDDDSMIFSVCCAMDAIGAIAAGQSDTHPEPMDRVVHIARCFLDEDRAEWWKRSYGA